MATNNPRLYVAADTEHEVERLVWAEHRSQAVKHCFAARVASQADIARLMAAGVRVEHAQKPLPKIPAVDPRQQSLSPL